MEATRMMDWESTENTLLLNPRLPVEDRACFERAWREFSNRFSGQVGIATSGSSGSGKLIMLSRSALLASASAVNERFQSGSEDIWMKTLPSFHVGGLGIHARAHLSGAHVVESTLPKWEARAFADELARSRATLLSLVPTQLYDLVEADLRAPPGLRAVIIGGGKLDRDLHMRSLELGWPVHPSYGLTECCSQVATAVKPEDPRLFPLGHVKVRSNAGGLFELQSEALLTGWIEFSGQGVARFCDPKKDGWFTSEDRGQLEKDGSLTVLGRTIDFVKIGGEGVSLVRLEEKLKALKAAVGLREEAAVLAATDERLGARIVLVTNASEGAATELVESFNREVLPFERIRSVHVLPELPKSDLGKLLRGQALALAGLKPAVTFGNTSEN